MISPTMKTLSLLLFASALVAQMAPGADFPEPKIGVQNSILAQVNGKTISMIDVKKKMDVLFHQHYPQFALSNQYRFQFYETSWRHILREMVDNELILSDAADKEIKLSDGEVRETMEERFGPNVTQTLDKIGLTYDEAWKMVKSDMTVQRMSFWFIRSKAEANIAPQDIRQAYRHYLEEHPAYSEWKYRVVSIRVDNPDNSLPERVYRLLSESGESPELIAYKLKELETPEAAISISNEFAAQDKDLSEVHREALSSLAPGSYSKPSFQKSRSDKKTVYRIFYLLSKEDRPAPSLESLSPQLKNDLFQKAFAEESNNYLTKLRKHYGFENAQVLPDDFHPFSLQ